MHMCTVHTNLITTSYSLSFPLDSLHLRYLTEASTLAAEKVLGSFSNEITLNRIVLHGKRSEGGRRWSDVEGSSNGMCM